MDHDTGTPSFHHGEAGPIHPSLFSDADNAGPQPPPLPPSAPQLTGQPTATAPEDGVTFAPESTSVPPIAATPNAPIVNRQARNDDLANKALMGVVGTGLVLRKLLQIVVVVIFVVVFVVLAVSVIHAMGQSNTGP